MTTGQKIRQKRKEKRMLQQELADKLGVSRETVIHWEKDDNTPGTENLKSLSFLFKVPLSYFLEEISPTILKSEFNADRSLLIVIVNVLAALYVDNTILKIKQGLIPPGKALSSHKEIVAGIFSQAMKAAPLLKDWPFPDHH